MIHPFHRFVSDEEASDSSESKRAAMDSNFKSIAKEATIEIDGQRLEDLVNIQPNVKIVILKNFKNLTTIVDSDWLQRLENTQIFVIVIRLGEAFDNKKLSNLSDKIVTSTIIQIDNTGSRRLFFSNIEQKFEEVKIGDSRNVHLSTHFDFNFVCNLLYSQPEKFGKFSFKITEMKIDTNACFEGKRLIDLAIENGHLLTLKFLMLFQPDIDALNGDKKRILEILVGNGNLELLKAVLEIPDRAENFEAYLSAEKRSALNLLSEDDLSLLMIAARSGKDDVIKFLLKCRLNVNCLNRDKQTACDFAWDNGHFNSVTELVDADSPFPLEFGWNQLSNGSELKKIAMRHYNLHEQIQNNQIDEVKKFLEQNPQIKCAYDERNQSALVTALESKNFEIYSFLRSKGYTSGIDGDDKKILATLTDSEKEELKLSNRKYFPTNENGHIMDLLSRSRLGFGNDQKNFEKIQKYFEALDAIIEVRPILQVISMANKLDIVFDFNQESIADMDPTGNLQHIVVKGRTFYSNGNILIGAKSEDAQVLATMAHEFTHYAMHLVYDNLGHPYHADDEKRKQEFAKIVNFCKVKKSLNAVIENVFTYDPKEHVVELIVRVPQLIALHCQDPNTIAKVREDFEKLFGFFNEKVLSEFIQEIPVMKAKETIRNLNNILGVKTEAEKSELFCKESKIGDTVNKSENILITSSVPNLVLCNLLNQFKENGTRNVDLLHIFIKLEQLMDDKLGEVIYEAFHSDAKPKLFVFETKDVINYAEIKEFYNLPTMRLKVVTIAKSVSAEKEDEENFENVFPIQHQIEYKWCDLSETSQKKILSSKVPFQGLEMPLSDLLTADSEILKELPLEKVFKLPEIKLQCVYESESSGLDIYIERQFKNVANQIDDQSDEQSDLSKSTADHLTTNDVIELLISEKSLILADDSGMGKTTTALHLFRELKQLYPRSWVVHIDLKQNTDSFYNDDDVSPEDITAEFFSAKILQLDGRLEQKFFEHFYVNGKVIFILDGFDEICPDYKKCVLKIVENVQKSKNLLLIATRTHLMEELKKRMSSKITKLYQFTIDDQVEFLMKFWRTNRPEDELEAKTRSLLEKFREIIKHDDFFGVPLHVRMLAEIYEKSDPTEEEIRELSIFSLYQRFIKKKIDLWIEKGLLAKEDSKIVHSSSSLNILQIHQKLAIEMFFTEDITEAMDLPEIEDPLTDELLARIGLVRVEGIKKLIFTHLSFSEYFVADFVLSNVAKKTMLAKSDELHQMFLQTLNDEKFENVRSFMNAKLEMKENLNVDVLSAKLENSLEVEENRKFLPNLVDENLDAFVTFMLTTVKISNACKVSLITQKNENGDTALLHAAQWNSFSSFKNLWTCIESVSNEAEQTDMLLETGTSEENVLINAIDEENLIERICIEKINFLLDTAASLIDSQNLKKWLMQKDIRGINALIKSSASSPVAFDMLWKLAEAKLQPEDQKNLLFEQDKYKRNFLQAAVIESCHFGRLKYQKVIQSILRIMKKLFNYEEMKTFLFNEDDAGNIALHMSGQGCNFGTFSILWNFIKETLRQSDQKILWKKKNIDDENIFVASLRHGELEKNRKTVSKEIISASKEILDPEEIWEALTEKNFRNESFISLAADMGIVGKIFKPEELGRVASEYMFRNNANLTVGKLRCALIDSISAQELKALLYAKVENGDTALFVALQFGPTSLVDRIFQLADIKLSRNERLQLILTKSLKRESEMLRRSEHDLLKQAIGYHGESSCTKLGKAIERIQYNEFLRLILPKALYHDNILRRSGKNVYSESVDIVCNFLVRQTDLVDGVKALFMEYNKSRNNFLSYAALRNSSLLIDVLDWFKKYFSHSDDFREVFFKASFESKTLIDYVAECCDESLTEKFFDLCFSSFGLPVVKEMILDDSDRDFDALDFSLRNPSSAVVGVVWNVHVQTLNDVELEDLLFKRRTWIYFREKLEFKSLRAIQALKDIIAARYGEGKMLRLVNHCLEW